MENIYFITFAYGKNALGFGNMDWSTGDRVIDRDDIDEITKVIRKKGLQDAIVIGFSKYE